jgi:KUP system potassium uptake protein
MAVTGTITITTVLFLYVARVRWRTPLWILIAGGGALLLVDLMFLAANLTKLLHGAWLPLLIGLVTFTVLTTWQRGSSIVEAARRRAEDPLGEFVGRLALLRPPLPRIPGTAVFLNRGGDATPLSLSANVEHNRALHEHTIVVAVDTPPVPRIPDEQRITVDALGNAGDGIFLVSARFGYMERPNVPAALRLVDPDRTEGSIDIDHASFFLSQIDVCAGPEPTMAAWRKALFIATSHLTADRAGHFGVPVDQTVIIGSRIQI